MVARLPRNGQGSTVWQGSESSFKNGVLKKHHNQLGHVVKGQDGFFCACSSWKFDVQHLGKTLPGSSGRNPASQKSARRFCRNMSFAGRETPSGSLDIPVYTHIYIYVYTYV